MSHLSSPGPLPPSGPLPARIPHRWAAALLTLHLTVIATGAWAGAALGPVLLPLTLADCGLVAVAVTAHGVHRPTSRHPGDRAARPGHRPAHHGHRRTADSRAGHTRPGDRR